MLIEHLLEGLRADGFVVVVLGLLPDVGEFLKQQIFVLGVEIFLL